MAYVRSEYNVRLEVMKKLSSTWHIKKNISTKNVLLLILLLLAKRIMQNCRPLLD
jgi:hypothetical protein